MTNLARLASMIFNRVHAIEPGAAEVMLMALDGRIGNLDIRHADAERASRFEGEMVRRNGRWDGYNITPRGTAIVPIVGEFVNRGAYLGADSGLISYEGVRQQLKNAAGDPSIRAIVLDIDSPGGMVAGCAETAGLVREISQRKPVVAVANSDTCSAAYAIASGANIIVATESSRVGSIGVVYVHADHSKALEKKGVAVTIFQGGKHKTDGHPFGPLSEEVVREMQDNIAAHHQAFVNLVIAGRPQLREKQIRDTEARVYRGEEAVALGLADRVGTFEQSVVLAESGQVPTRSQARSSVPTPSNAPQKVAAKKGVSRMTDENGGWENMPVSELNKAVEALQKTLGVGLAASAAVAAEPKSTAPIAPSAQPVQPSSPPQPAASQPAETIEQAAARGRGEEKARVKGILALAEAKDRPLAALALAVETDIPVAAAGAVLGKVPVEAKANGASNAVNLRASIAASGGSPQVRHQTQAEDQPRGSSLVSGAKEMAARIKSPTKMQIPTAR